MTLTERAARMISIISVLVGLATIAVVLRIYARLKLRLMVKIDDYLCIGAMLCLLGMLTELILWCVIGGNGSHIQDLNPKTILNFGKIFLSNQFTYFLLCPLLKISIVCFYQRIFATTKFQRISRVVIWVMGLWGTGIFLACALQCRPLRGYWDKSVKAQCFNPDIFFIVNQAFNVIMDFVILGLPLPIIWGLKRSWQDKAALTGVFSLGGFVCFASIYRIVVLFYINPNDITYTVYQATLWTHIEPSVGMICCCLPSIRGILPAYGCFRSQNTTSPSTNNLYGTSSIHGISDPYEPSSVYIKMNDVTAYKAGSDEEVLVTDRPTKHGQSSITVRTDIEILRG